VAASRCARHGKFPAKYTFTKCPICGEHTDYLDDEQPDEGWELRVLRALELREQEELEPLDIPELQVTVRSSVDKDGAGQLWLHAWDVYHAGCRRWLQPHELIRVGKQTFEILRHDRDGKRYIVRTFHTTVTDEDLQRLLADVG